MTNDFDEYRVESNMAVHLVSTKKEAFDISKKLAARGDKNIRITKKVRKNAFEGAFR